MKRKSPKNKKVKFEHIKQKLKESMEIVDNRQRFKALQKCLITILKISHLGVIDLVRISGMPERAIRGITQMESEFVVFFLDRNNQNLLFNYLDAITRMVRIGYYPIPDSYSGHCRGVLVLKLYEYFKEMCEKPLKPLPQFEDVENLQPTEADLQTKNFIYWIRE